MQLSIEARTVSRDKCEPRRRLYAAGDAASECRE